MPSIIEQYREAVAEKSRAEEYRRTAVQHCDTYRAIHRLNYWTSEVQRLLALVRSEVLPTIEKARKNLRK